MSSYGEMNIKNEKKKIENTEKEEKNMKFWM